MALDPNNILGTEIQPASAVGASWFIIYSHTNRKKHEHKSKLEKLFSKSETALTERLLKGGLIPENETYVFAANSHDLSELLIKHAGEIISGLRGKGKEEQSDIKEGDYEAYKAEIERNYAEIGSDFPSPMSKDAFYGIAGQVIDIIAPVSEASREALLVQFLLAVGNLIGGGPFMLQAGRHRLNEFAAIVGKTGRGRKGTSWTAIRNLLESVDSEWLSERVSGGIPSGEAIITAIRDPKLSAGTEAKGKGKAITSLDDPGIIDKRLLMMEEEFKRLLSVGGRNGNTIIDVLRLAWDNPPRLSVPGKHKPETATGAHISLIGHITKEELTVNLKSVEQSNGFANRFVWVASERTQKLSRPPWIEWKGDHPEIVQHLLDVVNTFSNRTFNNEFAPIDRQMSFSRASEKIWDAFYNSIDDNQQGVIGHALARAEAHVLRFSMIFATLDKSALIKAEHIRAAIALWDYCARSAKWAFGESSGNQDSDKVLRELKRRPDGMTRTDISIAVFQRHRTSNDVSEALRTLRANSLAYYTTTEKAGNGKIVERWFAKIA